MDKESIFAEALAKDSPEGRARFLDEACAGDAKLRAEIEDLLAAHDDAASFLNRPPEELELTADSDGNTGRDGSRDAWRELLEPSDNPDCLGMLGPYEVVELVGRGGMGVVLRARDAKLNRTVAIKLLAPELSANAMAVRRFLREAQAAAAVSHDHVVTIHAIDEAARPPIIVMEYVDGQSLQQKIDAAGALDVKSILRIGMQTAAGLAAAHRQGLVHRDIKPSNILLENGIERVKLTDFGLARAVDDIGMTRTGQITGTPQYMSPEQAQGKPIDHRTDLFSLGCVLYAMCTGRVAFRADSAVAVMHRVVHDRPRPIRELNDDTPVWLCEIVDRLLEKSPDDRFASAEEVEHLLGRHLVHLQQPDSEPRPEHAWPIPTRSPAQLDEKTEKGLTFVRNVLAFFGVLCVMWFVGCLAMPYHGFSGFGFTMPTVLVSLLTGGLAINGAWHAAHRQSYGWTLVGSVGLLFPVNLPQMFGLFFTVWASAILWRQDIKDAFESQSNARRYYGRTHHARGETAEGALDVESYRSWLAGVPIAAWIATFLFAVVYLLAAAAEGGGLIRGHVAEPFGVLFYLMATSFVVLWGCVAVVRWMVGRPPKPPGMHSASLAIFFGTVTLITGAFVSLWTPFDFERPWAYWDDVQELWAGERVQWENHIAPWEDFRWDGDNAYSQIDGVWYELKAIQEIPLADVLAIADSNFTLSRRTIVEDLLKVLVHMPADRGFWNQGTPQIQLTVRKLAQHDERSWFSKRVEMTAEKRRMLLAAMFPNGPPFDGTPASETAGPPLATEAPLESPSSSP